MEKLRELDRTLADVELELVRRKSKANGDRSAPSMDDDYEELDDEEADFEDDDFEDDDFEDDDD